MPDIAAEFALTDFMADLERVDQLLGMIVDFREFAATLNYREKYPDWTQAQQLMMRADLVRTDLPVLSGSLLMYVCGRFENFVRELVGGIVDEIVDHVQGYEELPEALRREYLNRTLQINQNPSRYNYTSSGAVALAAGLAANIASINDASYNLRIDASVITVTEANMNSLTVADLFKRVGMEKLWDTLGKQSGLRVYLGKSNEAECARAAKERIDEIMTARNRIAHPTKDTDFPDAGQVREMAKFLGVLAKVLTEFAPVATLGYGES
jgi:hypothetical protein